MTKKLIEHEDEYIHIPKFWRSQLLIFIALGIVVIWSLFTIACFLDETNVSNDSPVRLAVIGAVLGMFGLGLISGIRKEGNYD